MHPPDPLAHTVSACARCLPVSACLPACLPASLPSRVRALGRFGSDRIGLDRIGSVRFESLGWAAIAECARSRWTRAAPSSSARPTRTSPCAPATPIGKPATISKYCCPATSDQSANRRRHNYTDRSGTAAVRRRTRQIIKTSTQIIKHPNHLSFVPDTPYVCQRPKSLLFLVPKSLIDHSLGQMFDPLIHPCS